MCAKAIDRSFKTHGTHVLSDLTVQAHDLSGLVYPLPLELGRRHLQLRLHRAQGCLRHLLRVWMDDVARLQVADWLSFATAKIA